jgi:hypothetical protein
LVQPRDAKSARTLEFLRFIFTYLQTTYDESLAFAAMIADRLLEKGLHFNTVHQIGNPAGAKVPALDANSRACYPLS